MRYIRDVMGTKPECECIIWKGYVQSGGYGQVYTKNGRMLVHRKTYMEVYGPIPPGMYVCHQCDNKLCINPKHLYLGNPKDNTQDAYIKNIIPKPNNKNIPRKRVLSKDDVLYIRNSKQTLKDLSHTFKVSKATISMVRRGLRKI